MTGEPMSFLMFSAVVFLGLFSAFEVSANAQSTGASPSTQQPIYTLHANKRVVLTDVTVTDHKGNPIHGLRTFYLYLGGWDMNTGQFGRIQLSLDATHPKPGIKEIKN
jgi:hypothetical protein